MSTVRLDPFTKVRVTIDNADFSNTSVVWQPSSVTITGIVQPSNEWDEPGTIRLLCEQHTLKFPVIPLRIIQQIETDFTDTVTGTIKNFKPPTEKSSEIIFMIESSKTGVFYRVTKNEDKWTCNCIAGLHQKKCKHVVEAQQQYDQRVDD